MSAMDPSLQPRTTTDPRTTSNASEAVTLRSSSRSPPHSLNPQAQDFKPVAGDRLPNNKRKANSPARTGKCAASTSSVVASKTAETEPPLVHADQIFRQGGSTRCTGRSELIESMFEDLESAESSASDDSDDVVPTSPTPALSTAAARERARRRFATLCSHIRYAPDANVTIEAPKLSALFLVTKRATAPDEQSSSDPALSSTRLSYLPLCPADEGRDGGRAMGNFTILPTHQERVRHAGKLRRPDTMVWPAQQLPVEIFDLITMYLARDDIESMRLVNREFELKVSRALFATSVVPFNTELYDMINEDAKAIGRGSVSTSRYQGKQKAAEADSTLSAEVEPGGLQWQNARDDRDGKVYKGHGLRVFQGFGPNIKRFGISFEVSELQLAHPPVKKELDHVESYHGTYTWPPVDYARFAKLDKLERAADETSKMKVAFSHLTMVQELALSMDSGLGWLIGKDKSIWTRIFQRPSSVFGTLHNIPDHATQAAEEFWSALQQSHARFMPDASIKESVLRRQTAPISFDELDEIRGSNYADPACWSTIDENCILKGVSRSPMVTALYATAGQPIGPCPEPVALVPNELRKEQKEWLLETEWAQRAFLESYILAVADNQDVFRSVTTLKIAKMSSGLIPMIARGIFWDSLPCLRDVTLHVSPDWRSVAKDEAGLAETRMQDPSMAVRTFRDSVLKDQLRLRGNIKKLNIGWIGGGEDATGMGARNAHILPAPLMQLEDIASHGCFGGLVFASVEHLTLYNSWITPAMLKGLVESHADLSLTTLTLDSVSLTAPSRLGGFAGHPPPAMPIPPAIAAHNQQVSNAGLPGALQQQPMQATFAQQMAQLGPGLLQGVNPQQIAIMHQQWHVQMQQMQQAFLAFVNPGAPHQHPFQQWAHAPQFDIGSAHPVHWSSNHRPGSWPSLLDEISPGPILADYLATPPPWEIQPTPPTKPASPFRTLELISCGYARLPHNTAFDNSALEPEPGHSHRMSQWFRIRHLDVCSGMLETKDRFIGDIVQFMPQRELDCLLFAWGLREGWTDRRKAEEAEYDGFLPGGTGRVSGRIERGMPLAGQTGVTTGEEGAPGRANAE